MAKAHQHAFAKTLKSFQTPSGKSLSFIRCQN